MSTYKIALIGDGGVGKTSFVNALQGNVFHGRYVATLGVEVSPICLPSIPDVCFNIWDCAGVAKFGGLRTGYFPNSHAAIVMFDLVSEATSVDTAKWIQLFREVCSDAPIIYVANKSDAASYEAPVQSFACSSKYGTGLVDPMRQIVQLLA